MDWIKKNFDRVILLVVALVAIYFAVTLILKANSFGENFVVESVTPKNEVPDTPKEDVLIATQTLGRPSVWGPPNIDGVKPALFLSVPIVEKDGEIYNMHEPEPQLRPPVDNLWLIENSLEFLRSDVLERDADRDGFKNLLEFEEKTEPDEESDHPPFTKKLVLVERKQEDYQVAFQANNNPTFQVERITPNRVTRFVKQGEKFSDDRFVIESFTEDEVIDPNSGIKRDASYIMVKDLETGQTVKLVLRQPVNLPVYFAVFEYRLGDPEQFTVREGDTFKLPSGDPTAYKLKKVEPEEAVIENIPEPGGERVETRIGKTES